MTYTETKKVIMSDLRAGYGVEDIEARRSIPAEYTRRVIADLRSSGALPDVYRGVGPREVA